MKQKDKVIKVKLAEFGCRNQPKFGQSKAS